MSLSDEFFKGVEFGTNWVRSGRNQRDEEARRRIMLDAAQMQLEDDLMTREARLHNTIAKLDNEGSFANQQRRFRDALEAQQYLSEKSKIGADIANNTSTILGEGQAQSIAQDTFAGRRQIAMNNVASGVIDSNTGITNAKTNAIHAGVGYGATRDNQGNIRTTLDNNYQTGATLSDVGRVQSGQQYDDIIRAQKEARLREKIIGDAITNAGMDKVEMVRFLETMAGDEMNDRETRVIAATIAQEIKGDQNNPGVNPMAYKIEVDPVGAIQILNQQSPDGSRLEVVEQNPNGDYVILNPTTNNLETVSINELKARAARMAGVDDKAYSELARIDFSARSKERFGDTTLAGVLGAGALNSEAPKITETGLNRLVYNFFINNGYRQGPTGEWYDPATSRPVDARQFSQIREEIARRYGVTLEGIQTPATQNSNVSEQAPVVPLGGYYGGL